MQKYVFAFAFYCLIQSICIAVINLQAARRLGWCVSLFATDIAASTMRWIARMFELLFIVVSIALLFFICNKKKRPNL